MNMQLKETFIVSLLRAVVSRRIRNGLRKPGTTFRRMFDHVKRWRGVVAEIQVTPGLKLRCHPICVEEFSVFENDPNQKLEMLCFQRLAKEGMRFIDVGAHWGVFTLASLQFGGAHSIALGIEASKEAARIYKDNLKINNVEERVHVVNAACGGSVGELKMLTTGAGGADYFVIPAGNRTDTVNVAMVSVDHVVNQVGFVPTHLKIDVEGFEEEVLKGARETLEKARPIVFLELHGDLIRERGANPMAVVSQLWEAGYTILQMLDGTSVTIDQLDAMKFNARLVALHVENH